MQAALDFKVECDRINDVLKDLPEADFARATLFKSWSIRDIIGHLHLWNIAADQTLTAPDAFQLFIQQAMGKLLSGVSHPELQDEYFKGKPAKGIYHDWRNFYPVMSARFAAADPVTRVKWAGPDMSVRSCIIARQMEHWAHAQAIYDVLGLERENTDRLKNVAHIGVTTYSWSFRVKGLEPLLPKPYVRLTAPGGALWEWNGKQGDNRVEGLAEEFCQVVTQCRNIGDTRLTVIGENAATWMQIAQCFAGRPETPPAKGTRYQSPARGGLLSPKRFSGTRPDQNDPGS